MTERGLPIADGAPACPFVAFEDDRDERAASPDHRHRCYAESQPAPRALAHQEAYCLSSAFPVCPTFQDWARREAARSRIDPPRPLDAAAAAAAAADLPQRNPPRNWAAPPPWSGRGRGGGGVDGDWEDDEAADDGEEVVVADVPRRGRGLSGSYADRVASDPIAALPGGMPDDPDADADEPAWEDEPSARAPEPPRVRHRERDPGGLAAMAGAGVGAVAGAATAGQSATGAGGSPPSRRREGPAPEWERAKAPEAYPTLRSRRLSELSIPPILVAVVALALAAAVLFALPGLFGFGGPQAGASPTPSTPIRTPLPSLAPTPIPQPTQTIYVVKANDTMSRIAGKFGIGLEELIAANAENIPNPDTLQIGDQVIIPVPAASSLPAASEVPATP
jgi:hypothetical protein